MYGFFKNHNDLVYHLQDSPEKKSAFHLFLSDSLPTYGNKTFMLNKRKKQLVSNCADSSFKLVSAQAE